MLTKQGYSNYHILCGNALSEYENGMKKMNQNLSKISFEINWLERHKRLFSCIIIKPKGLPGIIIFEYPEFYNIEKFGKLYEKLREDIISDNDIDDLIQI